MSTPAAPPIPYGTQARIALHYTRKLIRAVAMRVAVAWIARGR
jgi:hypothetical protein